MDHRLAGADHLSRLRIFARCTRPMASTQRRAQVGNVIGRMLTSASALSGPKVAFIQGSMNAPTTAPIALERGAPSVRSQAELNASIGGCVSTVLSCGRIMGREARRKERSLFCRL